MNVSELSIDEFKSLVKSVVDESLENYLEDFEALSNKNYLNSIKKSREEAQNGELISLDELDV